MSDTPKDVGVLLKQERERREISLDVVHESTKVPLDALKAIEEGYKVRTLSAFYYRSFVKIYAQYLGLDAGAVVALIPTHHPKPAVPVPGARPGVRPGGAVRPLAATGAGPHRVEGVRSWNLLSHPIVLKKKKKVFKAVIITVLVIVGLAVAGGVIRKITTSAAVDRALDKAAKQSAAPAAKAGVRKPVPAAAPVAPRSEAPRPAAQAAPAAAETKADDVKGARSVKRASMTVRAQTTTWVNVHVDGSGVFRGQLKRGSAETWRGARKVELVAKDIGALEFEVNGRSIGKVGRKDLKARKVIVTPEGFSVEK